MITLMQKAFFAATSLLIDNILQISEFQTVIHSDIKLTKLNGLQNIRNVGWQVDKFCPVTSSEDPYTLSSSNFFLITPIFLFSIGVFRVVWQGMYNHNT